VPASGGCLRWLAPAELHAGGTWGRGMPIGWGEVPGEGGALADRWAYAVDELEAAERAAGGREGARSLLGGKGANLAEMTRLGLPVPPGFTVTTEACLAFLAGGERFPEGLWDAVTAALGRLEQTTGKRFGDPANPLLLSCRSGARVSMPGMMDTILNSGLNDRVVSGLAQLTGDERFAYDSYR